MPMFFLLVDILKVNSHDSFTNVDNGA